MFSLADILVIGISLLGIIIPKFIETKLSQQQQHIGMIIGCVYIIAITGAICMKVGFNQDVATVFTRIFLVAGVSHLIMIAGNLAFYRKAELKINQYIHKPPLQG